MQEFTQKLIAQARGLRPESAMPDAPNNIPDAVMQNLFRTRIGLWPILSSAAPEMSMGLMTIFAFLLERHSGIIAYRLFASVEESSDSYQWNMSQSQFSVDDWQLDGLDENAGMWGTLERENGGWLLEIEVENDLAEDEDEVLAFSFQAKNVAELVNLLPEATVEIATALDAAEVKTIAPRYAPTTASDAALEVLLKQVFLWERKLLLSLFGIEWTESEVSADFDALLSAAKAVGDDFAAWITANTISRAMLPVTPTIADALTPKIPSVVAQFTQSRTPALLLARSLFNNDHAQDAYDTLESDVETYPDNAQTRLALAILYQQGQHLQEMIETLQEAIDAGVTNADVFMVYGGIVMTLRQNGLVVPRYVLVEAPEREFDYMLDEAAAAYEAVLEEEPEHLAALQRRILLLMELDSPETLWADFARLVELDETGDAIRFVVDSFDLLEDVSDGLEVLQTAVEANPNRMDLRVSYGAALLADGDGVAAREQLEAAGELNEDAALTPDIERLLLSANDPNFEIRLGEITDMLNGNKVAPDRDIDFLEEVIENASSFGQAYLLLARAYQTRKDAAAALETLLDGQKVAPDDPEITEQLARLLWSAGERDLAFDYLNKGLGQNPDSVPLLALTGQYLYEDGQGEEAREFLTRAESLNPQNRVLREVQRFIAANLDS